MHSSKYYHLFGTATPTLGFSYIHSKLHAYFLKQFLFSSLSPILTKLCQELITCLCDIDLFY